MDQSSCNADFLLSTTCSMLIAAVVAVGPHLADPCRPPLQQIMKVKQVSEVDQPSLLWSLLMGL
jgi:electron transfer flavoprotein alpha/beta subunit